MLVGGINELLAEWLMSGEPGDLQQLQQTISQVMQALLLGGEVIARQEKAGRRGK